MRIEEQASRAIYGRLRDRARMLRGLAVGFIALIALTLAFGTIPYFLAGDLAVSERRAALEMRRLEADRHGVEKRDNSAGEAAGTRDAQTASDAPAAAPVRTQPGLLAEPTANQAFPVSDEAFAAAVIRTTAVVLLIGLVFVFGGLFRYTMRLAVYYDEKADSLRLLEAGDRQLEERLAQITVPGAAARDSLRRSVEGT